MGTLTSSPRGTAVSAVGLLYNQLRGVNDNDNHHALYIPGLKEYRSSGTVSSDRVLNTLAAELGRRPFLILLVKTNSETCPWRYETICHDYTLANNANIKEDAFSEPNCEPNQSIKKKNIRLINAFCPCIHPNKYPYLIEIEEDGGKSVINNITTGTRVDHSQERESCHEFSLWQAPEEIKMGASGYLKIRLGYNRGYGQSRLIWFKEIGIFVDTDRILHSIKVDRSDDEKQPWLFFNNVPPQAEILADDRGIYQIYFLEGPKGEIELWFHLGGYGLWGVRITNEEIYPVGFKTVSIGRVEPIRTVLL